MRYARFPCSALASADLVQCNVTTQDDRTVRDLYRVSYISLEEDSL